MDETKAVVPQMSFEEKMKKRIRDGIGDMLSDEELKKLIERGVEEALFQPRTMAGSQFGFSRETKLPLMEECLRTYLNTKVKAAVDQWLSTNPEKIQSALDSAMRLGIAGCVARNMDERMLYIFQSGVTQMQNDGLIPKPADA